MLSPHSISTPTPEILLATFDRHHGISAPPFASLNCGFNVGDDPDRVRNNRAAIKQALGIRRLISAKQIHEDLVYIVDNSPACDEEKEGVDALITNKRGIALMIQHADCQAILLHDPVQSVIAAVHCGWRGNVLGIIKKTVQAITNFSQSNPHNLHATISPALGPCCAEFIHYRQELPASFLPFRTNDNHFDFQQISRFQLIEAGLPPENIQASSVCTSCNPDFFSYRRARRTGNGITGRNASIILLKEKTDSGEERERGKLSHNITKSFRYPH